MSRSSEEVLLIVGSVKHKKSDGTLYMMGERMAWMQASKDSFTASHNYADIKSQKISPDSKEKVQLQIVMHDSSAATFQFANKNGRPAQVIDRDSVKDILQSLLPKFRHKVNSELEEKNRMLQEDPELFQLYKDLVVSGIVSSDEFWSNRVSQKKPELTNNNKQEVGVSAAFLADIKPQTDGCNGLKYNLTPDIIESVFRTYPAVKKKHAEYVPDKLNESEFWTRFFQSHYFHRDRINFSSKDLFADCVKSDDAVIQNEMESRVPDPLINLSHMKDSSLDEGYGINTSERDKAVSNPTNSSLIKRFNQHSTMVLKACMKDSIASSSSKDESQQNGSSTATSSSHLSLGNGGSHKALGNGASTVGEPPTSKKARIHDKVSYEDLSGTKDSTSGASLNLAHMDRYLHGPTPVTAAQYNSTQDIVSACHAVKTEIHGWTPNLTQVLHNNLSVSILGELSPGGALMQGYTQQQLHQMVPTDIQQEMRNLYNALCELLRHFWLCFPVTSSALEEKVMRMKTNLERFQMAKLQPLKDKLQSYHYSIDLTGHLEEMLAAAYTKFNTWQTRKLARR